jgi:hypothetical protein
MSYLSKANKLWKKEACWIQGEGRYAVLSHCRILAVSLHETLNKAIEIKNWIDRLACGGECFKNHEIFDLETSKTVTLETINEHK